MKTNEKGEVAIKTAQGTREKGGLSNYSMIPGMCVINGTRKLFLAQSGPRGQRVKRSYV